MSVILVENPKSITPSYEETAIAIYTAPVSVNIVISGGHPMRTVSGIIKNGENRV